MTQDKPDLSRVMSKVGELREFIINLYKDFIPIRALAPENGGDGEWDRAQYLINVARQYFDDVKVIEAPDPRVSRGSRPNVVATIKGIDESRTFWVIAHMDTVPEGDRALWSVEPYQATVKGDLVYGRGVEDNGQGIVMGLAVGKVLRDLGIKPPFNYGLILASDEEVGSKYGIRYILDTERDLFKASDLILVPDAGNPDGSMIEIAEKAILWLRITITGKQGHASVPESALNAHRLGMMLALKLDEVLHSTYNAEDPLFTPPESTFEPTRVDKNVDNVNTIPGRHVFYFDCRVLPRYSLDDVLATVNKTAEEFCREKGCGFSVEVLNRDDPAPPTSPNSEVVQRLTRAIKMIRNIDVKYMGIGGGTYAKYIRMLGIPVAVWMTSSNTAHSPDERVNLNDVINDVKVTLASMMI
ncbi:M20 family metallo-hydrolase [Caldivirga maquilingensis]|uniref:Acetylornithine deacetylase or succinyl-diaminopimelate desuccinylase n=1 Tax=Caldivirga maquilingensis (strain ATCC 700844 / DSM 13496 / JCM 10307 / IC-167) TaxID=397948 RepID=A8MA35_CALMQ|nr:M20 family metallo-hydrolase [Caldivirga maquilingensis]ABW00967.1 acetylornithine deacetylase or succinyl-diaminopimelate desuccinylase [Caldivirga maquilingensis IC-167]